ncbi:hypothetical protein PCG10_004969 [Penicillium crustosum]|uniref:Uncharacterized protein n=1 Tax=Penicillium crustosum TaxID=36656 RepID=A0A9P5GZ32_PENCR|nr:uncharacterized protein N7487_006932 [Penicillium crustosum]KAF7529994.1 hypothetical protein PCG10_004969 [Penicillium crustosum]KAJ5412573.1 hypothetical protein N7487_006932 [Penicillium crustosum]
MLKIGVWMFEEGDNDGLRHILGQVARYMRALITTRASLSTYNETIFLRKVDSQGVWTLEYSPMVMYDN